MGIINSGIVFSWITEYSRKTTHSATMSTTLKHGVHFADIVYELKIKVSRIQKLSFTLKIFHYLWYLLILNSRTVSFRMSLVSVYEFICQFFQNGASEENHLKIWHRRCSVLISIWKSIVWTFKLMKRLQIKICQLFSEEKAHVSVMTLAMWWLNPSEASLYRPPNLTVLFQWPITEGWFVLHRKSPYLDQVAKADRSRIGI